MCLIERFVRYIHKMKCYLFSERFWGCRKTLFMLQITSVVSKVVESVDCCQPTVSLPDDHTKYSLPTLKAPLIAIPSSLCELLVASVEVTGENQVHNTGGHWAVLKSWKSQILSFIWLPVIRNASSTDTSSAMNIPLQFVRLHAYEILFSFLSWRSTKLTLNYACLQ